MEAMEAIKTRRSVRGFTHVPLYKRCPDKVLGAPDSYELMAVVAFGHPVKKERYSDRKELSELAFRERFGAAW